MEYLLISPNTVKRQISARDLFMRIMRVKRRSHKFVLHNFSLILNTRTHKFIKRPVLTNLHKFLTRIKMLLYGMNYQENFLLNEYILYSGTFLRGPISWMIA